ncbi:hypothetical protein [Treponema sp. R80B11-R83G3]
MRNIFFILAGISMAIGALIYPLFRDPNLLIWNFFPKPVFWDMCRIPINEKNVLTAVFVYSGPDFLWLLSGIFLLRGVWLFQPKTQDVYIAAFYIIAAVWNTGQYFNIVPGTFDFLDLLTMSGVALTEGIIFNFFIRRRIQNDEKKC